MTSVENYAGASNTSGAVPGDVPLGSVEYANNSHTNQAFTSNEKSNPSDMPPAYAPPSYYPPPNTTYPGYNGQPVIQTQPGVTAYAVVQPAVVHNVYIVPPNSYCCLSCCVLWLCNILFGLIAFVFSTMSMSSFDAGRIEQARKYGRVALWLNVAGIIVTSIIVMVLSIIIIAS